jgi:hypothetical protein
MRLSSLCWLAVTSIGTGAGIFGTLSKQSHYTIAFTGHYTRINMNVINAIDRASVPSDLRSIKDADTNGLGGRRLNTSDRSRQLKRDYRATDGFVNPYYDDRRRQFHVL